MKRSTASCVLLLGAFALSAVACEDRQDLPLPRLPGIATAPASTLVGLTLSGNVRLTSVGATSRLIATAKYRDGSTRDVSRETRWIVGDSRVLTMSDDGVITAVGFGRSFVNAIYANRSALARVTATPPGTFVISGRVREPGRGGVVDATVSDRATGLSATANADGFFSLAALPVPHAHLAVSKSNFEPRELDAHAATELDAPIQRTALW